MTATRTTVDQHRLFDLNQRRPGSAVLAEIERREEAWIEPLARSLASEPEPPTDRSSLFARLDELLTAPGPLAEDTRFVAEHCDLGAFRILVAEFAVDGLTEAQSFLPLVARLPIEPRMSVMRVLIDEFGCGNVERSHSHLYIQLLEELGLPTELTSHLPGTSSEVLAFVNLFYWLAARAPSAEWCLGALAHLEASIVDGFACYVAACERLGIVHDAYYREHVHIDSFHRREIRAALALLEQERTVDHAAAWSGARLAAAIFDQAFSEAVNRARRGG